MNRFQRSEAGMRVDQTIAKKVRSQPVPTTAVLSHSTTYVAKLRQVSPMSARRVVRIRQSRRCRYGSPLSIYCLSQSYGYDSLTPEFLRLYLWYLH
jgi:hypothetical protein